MGEPPGQTAWPRLAALPLLGRRASLLNLVGIWFFLFFYVEFVFGDSQIRRDFELLTGAQRDGRSDRGTLLQLLHSMETM